MKEEDIFNQNPYEVYDTFENNRLLFAIARKCHLYQYEKLIGVNFSVYFDYIDEDTIRSLPLISSNQVDEILDDNLFLDVEVKAYNFSTRKYVQLPNCSFNISVKEWVTSELKLTSDYIDSDSTVKIKFRYSISRTRFHLGGFLQRKKMCDVYNIQNSTVFQLTTVISRTDRNDNFGKAHEDDLDDLDDLLRQRGIK